jgi:hypothetical protein
MSSHNSSAIRKQPVRIVIPAKVAYDLPVLQKSLMNIAEALGCRTCFSGADCVFQLERNFVVDPETLKVRPGIGEHEFGLM